MKNDFEKLDETPIYVDEYKPMPPRNTWDQLSASELMEVKSRLIDYSLRVPSEQTFQKMMFTESIGHVDTLLNKI